MQYYFAIVHKDEGSAYGVEFPDLPGCFSAADDLGDVVANATDAIALWMEDQAEPAASSLEQVCAGAAEALAAGAFIVAVPHIAPSGKLSRINLSLDSGVLAAIDVAAGQRRQTRSAFMADAALAAIRGVAA